MSIPVDLRSKYCSGKANTKKKNDNEIWVWEKTYIKIALIRTLQKLICGLLNFNALSNQKIL